MFRHNHNIAGTSRDDVHVDAAIAVFRVDVRHSPSLMVGREQSPIEEMALSSYPSPTPDGQVESSLPAPSAPVL